MDKKLAQTKIAPVKSAILIFYDLFNYLTTATYFPMQNFEKMVCNRSVVLICPVISPM